MFDNLTQRLQSVIKNLTGQSRLTDANIEDALRDVRMALLEADVALPVVREFTAQVKTRALGQEVIGTLTPGQALIRVVRDELTRMMGEANSAVNLRVVPPAVILLAGLQGSGKTTSAAKLARRLIENERKSVLLASADVYRPAAIEQLCLLAGQVQADFYTTADKDPLAIARGALTAAQSQFKDVLIVDTAGRLAIDAAMMTEIKNLHAAVNPVETLFVIDSMMGQDAVNTAKTFDAALPLTGVIVTKTDGDARGGVALSVRQITGKPIKFLGIGEKTDALEPFYPDRLAARILGMGDVLGLIEDVEKKIDKDKTLALAQKIKKGRDFDLQDFRDQLQQMRNLGGMGSLISKLPGMTQIPDAALGQGEKEMQKMAAMIDSMTLRERRNPDLIKGSRKKRIASGSGTQVQDVNRLLKQFDGMQKMMKQMSRGGMAKMLGKLKGMPGLPNMPGGKGGGMPGGGGFPGGGGRSPF